MSKLVRVVFPSRGCCFRAHGYCDMCNYGQGRNVTEEQALSILRDALAKDGEGAQEILLNTYGSMLDEKEISLSVLCTILKAVHESGIPTVIIETHYTTITFPLLMLLEAYLPNREIVIEMGLESVDPWVLKYPIHKYMNLDVLAKTISTIKARGMHVVLNVFLGAPTLTDARQVKDTHDAIEWAVTHGASRVVIFPANIKPDTRLREMYENGVYKPISHWLLIELLSGLDDTLLERVELSWYEDREGIITPSSCSECHPMLMNFYKEFLEDFNPKRRRQLTYELCRDASCSCRRERKAL